MYEDKLLQLILSDELTWEGLIREIVKKEGMNPWEIDIALLSSKYIEVLKELRKIDFRLSGKFLLAAAILLKFKSEFLFSEEVPKELRELVLSSIDLNFLFEKQEIEILPKIPPIRKRSATIDELINALKKAMEVEKRRLERKSIEKNTVRRVVEINIRKMGHELYNNICYFFEKLGRNEIKFSELTPSKERRDIIWTFLPLLFIANRGLVNLRQEEEFGEIYIGRAG